MIACMVVGLSCGPAREASLPRVCGRTGPAQVLSTDEPFRLFWTVDEVQGRWIVRRTGEPGNDDYATGFATDLVGPCGEEPVSLPAPLWPIRIGDALFACDVLDGRVYAVDPITAELGPPLAEGLECEPVARRTETAVVLLDPADEVLVVLDETGLITPTPIPLTVAGFGENPRAPYLNTQAFNYVRPGAPNETWVVGSDDALWRIQTAELTAHKMAESVDDFLIDGPTGLAVVLHLDEVEARFRRVTVVDPTSGASWEAPPLAELRGGGGYLLLAEGALDLRTKSTRSYPAVLDDASLRWLYENGYGLFIGDRVQLWDIGSGDLLVDAPGRGATCASLISLVDGALPVLWDVNGDGECARRALWLYPLDGSKAELAAETDAPDFPTLLSRDDILVQPFEPFERAGDITHVDRTTGERRLLDRNVNGLVYRHGQALDSVAMDESRWLYVVDDGDRSGLWRTALPR